MAVGQTVSRLRERLDLLQTRHHGTLPRHQTLRATLDWSYDLLIEAERVVLRRLAIFAGAFSLDAAGLVAAQLPEIAPWQVIECVSVLVSKSLVVADSGDCR